MTYEVQDPKFEPFSGAFDGGSNDIAIITFKLPNIFSGQVRFIG